MTTELDSKDEEADWMAIILQFLFGALIGGGVIFYESLRYGFGRGGVSHFMIVCAIAGASVLGSIAALFGDDTWGVSFRVIPNMPIRHSRGSRVFFIITMVVAALTPLIYWLLTRKG
jgi:hypothetical protein